MFRHKIDEAKRRHPQLKRCTCWDCLRAVGLTPPKTLRDKHPRRYPHTVFDGTIDEGATGDPDGVPLANRAKSKRERKQSPAEAADKRHLRSAIRNREAI